MDYMTFPWEQLGLLLRRLSLSGSAGNAAAWILFLAISGFPLAAAAVLLRRHRACRADFLLVALSAALFVGLWFFVNPSYIDRYLSPMPAGGIARFALASVIDSLLLTWLLLRFLLGMEGGTAQKQESPAQNMRPHGNAGGHDTEARHSMEEGHSTEKTHSTGKHPLHGSPLRGLRLLLILYALVLAVSLLIQGWGEFWAALTALREGNTGSEAFLVNMSTLFLALRAILELLPGAAQIALLLLMGTFLRHYERDPFGPGSCHAMERLKTASRRLLILILCANTGFNVLQLAFSRFLLTSSHRILFPLPEILVILGLRTLSVLYLESRRLKEDNDMFI